MLRQPFHPGGALILVASLAALGSCAPQDDTGDTTGEETAAEASGEMSVGDMTQSFTATLLPINDDATESTPAGGARVMVRGDSVTFEVSVAGLPADMMHLQHIHGFADGSPARCPDPDADTNGDGFVDLMETEAAAGVTMIPFHADPVSLEIQAESYPTADMDGTYNYGRTVERTALESALESQFGAGDLAVGNRVVFIHGVPADTELPQSVQSLGDVPAHVTLPIACGEFSAVNGG